MSFSVALYLFIMLLCMMLTYWSSEKNNNIGNLIAYSILFFFVSIRYDIGYDYSEYVYYISRINAYYEFLKVGYNSTIDIEPLFNLLSYIFKSYKYSYIYIFSIYAFLWTFFLYKTFQYYNIHTYGIFLTFIVGFVFVQMDQMRQGTSIAIFLYSIRYIQSKSLSKYLLFIIIAGLNHYSAFFMLPFYYLSNININRNILIAIILIFFVFFKNNTSIRLYELIATNLLGNYSLHNYETSAALEQFTSLGYKIRTLYYSLVWIYIVKRLPEKYSYFANLLFIGAIIFIVASGAMNIRRMSYYFTFTTLISIPLLYYTTKYRFLLTLLVSGLLSFYVRDMLIGLHQGCIPYKTIFTELFL